MNLGIGLPAAIPGIEGKTLINWAGRAEELDFSTLGTIDRIVYPNYEPLIALTAAAAVTDRIGLTTAILIAPYRPNTALLAKQIATLDHFSGGRLVLGIAIGARDDDYEASGLSTKQRGAYLDAQLDEMKRIWSGEKRGYAGAIGPSPVREGGPEVLVGGHVDAALRRAARFGNGWIMSGGAADQFGELAGKVDEAWEAEGRHDRPRKAALAYFSLGPRARENADWYIHDYYGWLGEYADQIAASVATTPEMVSEYVSTFEQAGCDELIMFPCSTEVEEVGRLAEAAKSVLAT
jgi:alkanesulfonate monooxygenase SsuD/methylene tetrahydromethanopterin reductase-like flavin-dependent oxidoreductase (luciferase family)